MGLLLGAFVTPGGPPIVRAECSPSGSPAWTDFQESCWEPCSNGCGDEMPPPVHLSLGPCGNSPTSIRVRLYAQCGGPPLKPFNMIHEEWVCGAQQYQPTVWWSDATVEYFCGQTGCCGGQNG
jgi:hypothetical protein